MPKPSEDHVRYFATRTPAQEIATALLGRRFADARDAAHALAALAEAPAQLGEILARLPGGALLALGVLATAGHHLPGSEVVARLDALLGQERGDAALDSLLGRGFVGAQGSGERQILALWAPLRDPVRALLGALDLCEVPAEDTASPDRGALAIALLLAQLARRRPKLTTNGALHRREADEIDRAFGVALGPHVAELLVVAFDRLGLLGREEGAGGRGGARLLVHDREAAAFLAKPRAERVRAFAVAQLLPQHLELAFRAGRRAASREALIRAARDAFDTAIPEADRRIEDEARRWIGYAVTTGILDEVGPGLRASREVRGQPAPHRPADGRWLVQPNLEILIPPDVPPADAFRLARFAEVVSLDRAAVLRLTPRSLADACEAGLDADGAAALLASRSVTPVPELALRALRDGIRPRTEAWFYDGAVAVVPADAASALRARGDFREIVRCEIAPGVFLLAEGEESRFARAAAGVGAEPRRHGESRSFGGGHALQLARLSPRQLERLLTLPEMPPADPRIAAARARALAGEAGEFALAPDDQVREALSSRRLEDMGLYDMLDELFLQLERGRLPRLEELGIPPNEAKSFARQMEEVLEGRADPQQLGPGFSSKLRSFLRSFRDERARGEPPGGTPARPTLAAVAAAPRAQASPSPAEAAEGLARDWAGAARAAIGSKLDLWIKLADEKRPRLVTPHRVSERGGAPELEALVHDSGDLRAFAGAHIEGATTAGTSAADHLPSGGARVALRAARNDRCPCGSGRKYKACCLPDDLAAGAVAAQL